jgi:hypothetical protein
MNLPRGNTQHARYERIGIRAEGILRGAPWAEEPDSTDINENEQAEIEAARRACCGVDQVMFLRLIAGAD